MENWLIAYILAQEKYILGNGTGFYSLLINNNTEAQPVYEVLFGVGQIN